MINQKQMTVLGNLAIAGQVILQASAWLLPVVSEYRLIGDNISELALGQFGFVQTAAFLIAGLTTLGLAYALRKLTAGAPGSFLGSVLVAVYGVGAVVDAIFPTDRIDDPAQVFTQSSSGMIHSLVALLGFLGMIVGMFVLARTFGKTARFKSLLRWSVLLGGAALALFVVQGEGPLVGLLQRAMVVVLSGWIVMATARVRAVASA
jgi:hypothetical protein